MTDPDLATIRALVDSNGFLPLAGRARALLLEVERLTHAFGPVKTYALRELCEELESAGFLPTRKATALLDGVEALRRGA